MFVVQKVMLYPVTSNAQPSWGAHDVLSDIRYCALYGATCVVNAAGKLMSIWRQAAREARSYLKY